MPLSRAVVLALMCVFAIGTGLTLFAVGKSATPLAENGPPKEVVLTFDGMAPVGSSGNVAGPQVVEEGTGANEPLSTTAQLAIFIGLAVVFFIMFRASRRRRESLPDQDDSSEPDPDPNPNPNPDPDADRDT